MDAAVEASSDGFTASLGASTQQPTAKPRQAGFVARRLTLA
jgi:hypothetical protein